MANKHIDLFKEIIPAVDLGMKDLWDAATEEGRKEIKGDFWTLNRYISNVKSTSREVQEHFVLTVNEYYNKNWNDIQKHPKLVWQTLCVCSMGNGKTYFHEWIPLKKQKNKKIDFLAELFPTMKMADVETLAAITTDKEIKEYARDLGWDKKQIADIKL
jgi:predicted CopG family antitoxin